MTIQDLGLLPDDNLHVLDQQKFVMLFDMLISKLCRYIGIKYEDDIFSTMFSELYQYTRNLKNLKINDVTATFESMMYNEDVKKITIGLIHKRLQKISIEKFQKADEREQNEVLKAAENPYWAKSLNLRMIHDVGGKILEQNGDTLQAVYECTKIGLCYYTGNEIDLTEIKQTAQNINEHNEKFKKTM